MLLFLSLRFRFSFIFLSNHWKLCTIHMYIRKSAERIWDFSLFSEQAWVCVCVRAKNGTPYRSYEFEYNGNMEFSYVTSRIWKRKGETRKNQQQNCFWVFRVAIVCVYVFRYHSGEEWSDYTFNHNDHQIHCITNVIKFLTAMINGVHATLHILIQQCFFLFFFYIIVNCDSK